jgi:hypothetical protein
MHPLLQQGLMALGKVGAKALAAAADSVLADAQAVGEEATARVVATRSRVAKATGAGKPKKRRKKPAVIEAEVIDVEVEEVK